MGSGTGGVHQIRVAGKKPLAPGAGVVKDDKTPVSDRRATHSSSLLQHTSSTRISAQASAPPPPRAPRLAKPVATVVETSIATLATTASLPSTTAAAIRTDEGPEPHPAVPTISIAVEPTSTSFDAEAPATLVLSGQETLDGAISESRSGVELSVEEAGTGGVTNMSL